MSKMSFKLYFATEENRFEGEKIGEFATMDELRECLSNNIADDVRSNVSVSDYKKMIVELTDIAIKEGDVVFENKQTDYLVAYIVTTDGRKARKRIAEIRREF